MIIKVCGITRAADVAAAAAAGVDWLGFNLWPQSKRFVTPELGRKLAAEARAAGLKAVALLVKPSATEVADLWYGGTYDMLQLYEAPATLPADLLWIRPYAVAANGEIQPPSRSATYDLIETKVEGHGGAGERFDWARLSSYQPPRPTLVAGGITPDNVAELLRQFHPAGIDVASGVESAPGIKDAGKIRALVANVRAVYA